MSYRRSLVAVCTLIAVLAQAVPAHAAPAALPGAGLVRFMLATFKYADLIVELDGAQVLRQPSNTMSTYLQIDATRNHTLKIFGYALADVGPTLVRSIPDWRVSPGVVGASIFADDGTETSVSDTMPPSRAGQSFFRPILAAQDTTDRVPTLSFAGRPFNYIPGGGDLEIDRFDTAQTARLELREFNDSPVIAAQHLRAQPGYSYDLIVVPATPGLPQRPFFVVVAQSPQLRAQPTTTRTFLETGHLLEGRFGQYWSETGGLPVFGFPLNDDHLTSTAEGQFVSQTFERNRFEHHPEKSAPYDVLLGRLGAERLVQLGRSWRAEYQPRPLAAGCEAVTTGDVQFALCEPFRSYYHSHGLEFDGRPGFSAAELLALLGLPLTQAGRERNSSGDDVLTQWFERARVEYHPENKAPYDVLLGRLGAEVTGLQAFTFDDEDRGFARRSSLGAADWREAAGGFGGHYWWTCAEKLGKGMEMSQLAGWDVLPSGSYDVEVFIPSSHANSRSVPYVWGGGHDYAQTAFNQKPYSDAWVNLPIGDTTRLLVHSNTGEANPGCDYQVAVDAIRLVPRNGPTP